MKPKPKKPTKSALAAQLGISRQLLNSYLKDPDAPGLDDLAGWIVFHAEKGRGITGGTPETRQKIALARLAILEEQKIKLQRENQVEAKELMPVADAIRQAAFACGYLFDHLERMELELPPSLAGCTAVEAAKILHNRTETLRSEAKARFQAIGE